MACRTQDRQTLRTSLSQLGTDRHSLPSSLRHSQLPGQTADASETSLWSCREWRTGLPPGRLEVILESSVRTWGESQGLGMSSAPQPLILGKPKPVEPGGPEKRHTGASACHPIFSSLA